MYILTYICFEIQDYIYEDELNNFVEAGVLSEISVAFSREAANKEYVQHKLAKRVGERQTIDSHEAYKLCKYT